MQRKNSFGGGGGGGGGCVVRVAVSNCDHCNYKSVLVRHIAIIYSLIFKLDPTKIFSLVYLSY